MAEKVGGVYIEIQARMGSLEKDLRTLQTRMQQVDNSGSQLSGTVAKFGKYLAGGAIAYGLLNIGKSALSASANMEKQKVAFTTMLGSAQKAQKLLDEMQAFAASTPFEFNEIVDASKKLISFGVSAEEVQQKLSAIGDIAAGLSIPLGELSEIYGKARVQGTLYAEDLNQLAGRGIPIFEELGKVMNVNAGQVKKLGSEGKISFDMLDQVFKNLTQNGGKFSGLMAAQSQTLSGKWSNFNDQLDKTALLLGDNMSKSAKAITDMMSSALSSFNEWLEKINKHNEYVQNLRDTWDESAKANVAANQELAVFINNISDGLGDATQYIDMMRAQYGDLLTATQVLHAYEMGMVTLSKERVVELQKIVELNNKQTGKDKKDPEKKTTTTGGGGESPWKKRQKEAENYYKAVEKINTSTDDPVKKVENEIAALDVGMTRTEWLYEKGKISKQQYENTLASYTEARIKKEEELEQAKFDRMRDYYNLGVSTLTGFSGQINELASMYASNQTTRIEQEAQKRTDALNAEYENQVAIIEASAASDSQKAEQKKALDEQLARDTKAISDKAEKDKRKAQRESAKISKQLAIFDTLITTPQAAIDSYTSLAKIPVVGPALGAAAAAAATALGLAKLKLIQDQPLPALAEGGIVPAIPGGRQITVAEGGNSEGVIPFNDRGVDILAQAMEKAISKIGRGGGTTNVYIDSELIYSNMYEASRRGAVKIDQRAIV